MWLKIKYFFQFTIPDLWDRLKYWIKHGNRLSVYTFFLVLIAIPTIAVQSYYRYENLKQENEEKTEQTTKQPKNYYNNVLNEEVMEDGPKKYLQEQLDLKTEDDVEAKFNDNAKLKGKYKEVIEYAEKITDVNELRDYLNPIIDELKSGETVKSASIPKSFEYKTLYDYPTNDDMLNGIMIIGINGNNLDEVKQANKIVKNAKNYKVFVYDIARSNSVKATYQNIFYQYIQNRDSGKYRPGFDSSFRPGKIYGFCNGLMTYNKNNLKDVPSKMPTKSISK